ncbi:MAG: hypothetical protein EA365_13895 [Gloeocapsa sp. DLM2.Bin57]|nr:MAG: hypothetical protein EA365_13895 [Gloeocapsa sp. DLM2.Bin57]
MVKFNNFCFCTLAIGSRYINLALLLADDLAKYSPEINFIVLTDNPKQFKNKPNVIPYLHYPQSCKFYNDKRFVIAKSLNLYESCIYIDADMRLLATVPENLNFVPGIIAYSSCNIAKINKTDDKKLDLIRNICQKSSLDISQVKFIQEFLFYVTRHENIQEFFRQWEILAGYFELKGYYAGEGNIIGLAAALARVPIEHDYDKKLLIFKDRIELVKQQNHQLVIDKLYKYLEEQRKYEHPQRNILEKIQDKISNTLSFNLRKWRLKVNTIKYSDIYSHLDKY